MEKVAAGTVLQLTPASQTNGSIEVNSGTIPKPMADLYNKGHIETCDVNQKQIGFQLPPNPM